MYDPHFDFGPSAPRHESTGSLGSELFRHNDGTSTQRWNDGSTSAGPSGIAW